MRVAGSQERVLRSPFFQTSLEYRTPAGGSPPKLADIPRQRPAPGQEPPCTAPPNRRRHDAAGTIPLLKVLVRSDPADTPQVEFQGPLFQLGHRHALKRRFRRVSESTSTNKARWHRKTGALGSVCHRRGGLRDDQAVYPTALRDLYLTAAITDEFPQPPPNRRPVPSGVRRPGQAADMALSNGCGRGAAAHFGHRVRNGRRRCSILDSLSRIN